MEEPRKWLRLRREQLQTHRGRFLHVPGIFEGVFSEGVSESDDVVPAAAGLSRAAAAAAAAGYLCGKRGIPAGGIGLVEGEYSTYKRST